MLSQELEHAEILSAARASPQHVSLGGMASHFPHVGFLKGTSTALVLATNLEGGSLVSLPETEGGEPVEGKVLEGKHHVAISCSDSS
jgi:hypothetical protein